MRIARQPVRTRNPGSPRIGRRGPLAARRGISLIELMVVMTGVAVILGLVAVTIQAMMRVNADAQARLSASAAFARLASQFREDVHACEVAPFPTDSKVGGKPGEARATARLRLTREPRLIIDYEASNGRVVRVESNSGKLSRRESYRIGKGNVVVFERRDEGRRKFVAMVMSRDAGKDRLEPPRPLEVLALQGKDRPAAPEEKGESPR